MIVRLIFTCISMVLIGIGSASTEPTPEATKSYAVNCATPADHPAADLCEQRRMAAAAEDAIYWTRIQALIGTVGFVGILLSLYFSGRAAKAAGDQVELSRHALVDTDRAFVFPRHTIWAARKDHKTERVSDWLFSVEWFNSGKTPTRNLHLILSLEVRNDPLPQDFVFHVPTIETSPTYIAPGASIETNQLGLSLEQLEEIRDGKLHLYVWGWAEYDDVFEYTRRHRTEFCHKWQIGGDPRNPEKFSFRYSVHNRYNGADEECEGEPVTASGPRTKWK